MHICARTHMHTCIHAYTHTQKAENNGVQLLGVILHAVYCIACMLSRGDKGPLEEGRPSKEGKESIRRLPGRGVMKYKTSKGLESSSQPDL